MQRFHICIPIIEPTIEACIKAGQTVPAEADLVEVRADYIANLTIKDLHLLRDSIKRPMILTCRAPREGGKWSGAEDTRIEILRHALTTGFEYVDVEYKTVNEHPELISTAAGSPSNVIPDQVRDPLRSKTILSYHNFTRTPTINDIWKLLREMNQYKCDMMKLAFMPQTEKDVQVIYEILTNTEFTKPIIAIAMGELGRMTRIIGPLLGSPITYAPVRGAGPSAPGQLYLDELVTIYQSMGVRMNNEVRRTNNS